MEPRPEYELLYARARLSLARMYLVDLENGADFSKMVDGRGNPFNCSAARWAGSIVKICTETELLLPAETAAILCRLLPVS